MGCSEVFYTWFASRLFSRPCATPYFAGDGASAQASAPAWTQPLAAFAAPAWAQPLAAFDTPRWAQPAMQVAPAQRGGGGMLSCALVVVLGSSGPCVCVPAVKGVVIVQIKAPDSSGHVCKGALDGFFTQRFI